LNLFFASLAVKVSMGGYPFGCFSYYSRNESLGQEV